MSKSTRIAGSHAGGTVLMVIGFALATVAAVVATLAVILTPRDGGANIGAGIAFMAILPAGLTGCLGLWARSPVTPSAARSFAIGTGIALVVVAGLLLLLVGLGILEELS